MSKRLRVAGRALPLVIVAILSAAVACSRTAFGPVQEAVRIALTLTDNQSAVLQGPALSLPLLLFSIPLGLLIDRYSRARLLMVFAVLNLIGGAWSGMAASFAALVAARCLVGLTTAAIGIAALSLLADFYAPEKRGRATMMTSVGGIIGMSCAFTLGGILLATADQNDDAWRWALLWLATPVAPATFLLVLLREPPRSARTVEQPRALDSLADLWCYRSTVLPLLAGYVLIGAAGAAIGSWGAPVLSRDFALSPQKVGAIMGMALLIGGLAGPAVGGVLADFCQRQGGPKRTMTILSTLAFASVAPALFPLVPSSLYASILLVVFTTLGAAIGVVATTLFTVILPANLRGLCLAVSLTAFAFFDGMLAPLAVSLLSGALGGAAMIGKALAVICAAASLLGAGIFWLAKRSGSKSVALDIYISP